MTILVSVVRFEAPFGAFGAFWWSILGIDFGAGGPFWGSIFRGLVFGPPLALGGFGFGPPLASGASVLDLLWFWTCSGFRGLVFEPPLASRCSFLGLHWLRGLVFGRPLAGSCLDLRALPFQNPLIYVSSHQTIPYLLA